MKRIGLANARGPSESNDARGTMGYGNPFCLVLSVALTTFAAVTIHK